MFQLCPDHLDVPKTCYFFKIPMEMRLRIYRLLLPDVLIPARRYGTSLRVNGEHTRMEILRVNRQIHDEATSLLYGTGSFNIEVSANGLNMCNKFDQGRPAVNQCNIWQSYHQGAPVPNMNFSGPPNNGNHALQDYQMQLMLLEQQNKQRLMFARQTQNSIALPGPSSSIAAPPYPPPPPSPTHPPTQPFIQYPIPYTTTALGPVWNCPLAPHYFNLIRHFRINILFPSTQQLNTSYPLLPHLASSRLYTHSDVLHTLIGRLLLLPHRISSLSIRIKFADTYSQRSETIYASQFLLRPFRRLANVITPSVSAIKIMSYQSGPEIDILPTLGNYSSWPDDANLLVFLREWEGDLKGVRPAMPAGGSRVFDAYWRLEGMVKGIRAHYWGLQGEWGLGISRMEDLLGVARVCREDGDEVSSFLHPYLIFSPVLCV